ncbi:MAG: type II toxin-antitoxin system Phd/YefM family antitoxin [Saccharothrix sp.]|nr:type II toxin-antitoxin system Phd/YefM family antitoxin [Saccharothrix sp.]
MKEMPASEASRNFSAVLDQAEHGETIVVTRKGRRVAMIVPAPRANGKALRELFSRWQGSDGLDEAFAANVAAARTAGVDELDEDPWRD